eukprot:INCI6335.1.p1 GENE.INCI6335.1~~INCI6335.1.p1  ORF type:complete len:506 (-),score=50.00 INCI6335.1:10-1527(-)
MEETPDPLGRRRPPTTQRTDGSATSTSRTKRSATEAAHGVGGELPARKLSRTLPSQPHHPSRQPDSQGVQRAVNLNNNAYPARVLSERDVPSEVASIPSRSGSQNAKRIAGTTAPSSQRSVAQPAGADPRRVFRSASGEPFQPIPHGPAHPADQTAAVFAPSMISPPYAGAPFFIPSMMPQATLTPWGIHSYVQPSSQLGFAGQPPGQQFPAAAMGGTSSAQPSVAHPRYIPTSGQLQQYQYAPPQLPYMHPQQLQQLLIAQLQQQPQQFQQPHLQSQAGQTAVSSSSEPKQALRATSSANNSQGAASGASDVRPPGLDFGVSAPADAMIYRDGRVGGRRKPAQPWTKEEDARLLQLVDKHGPHNWRIIAAGVGSRTPAQAAQRWRKTLDPNLVGVKKGKWTATEDALLRKLVKKYSDQDWQSVAKGFKGKRTVKHCRERWIKHIDPKLKSNQPWTADEDETLLQLRQKLGYNGWAEISRSLPGRTDNAVKRRYRSLRPISPQNK